MSKEHFIKAAYRELESLNRAIDQKIVSGLPYRREAKRHKFLTSQLSRVRRPSLFGMMFSWV